MALEPWHRSPEYQPLSTLRQAAVGMDMIIALEGMGTSPGPQWHTFAVPRPAHCVTLLFCGYVQPR